MPDPIIQLQSCKSRKILSSTPKRQSMCIIKSSDSLLHEKEDPVYDLKNLKGISNSKVPINQRKCEHINSFYDVHGLFVFNRLTVYFIIQTNRQRE